MLCLPTPREGHSCWKGRLHPSPFQVTEPCLSWGPAGTGWPASSKQNSRNKVNELMLIIFKCERLLVLLTTASWPAATSWCFSKGLHSRQTLDMVSCRLRRFPWNSCKSIVKATILHQSHPLRATHLAQTFAPYYDHGLSSTSLPFFTAIVLS